ncbi:MAG: ATP-binding protein [Candidatus Sumerlaeia bacterium]|nr:ATP-binding protein [Candidatus Sumerlaeia bacterium]
MNRWKQIVFITAFIVIPTLAHYWTDAQNGPAHDIYQRLYYIPVILAGLWFGLRIGIITAAIIAFAYLPHALHGWHGPHSLFYRLMEVGMYAVVGGLTGWLSDRLRSANESERRARRDAETAFTNLKKKTDDLFALEEQLRRSDRLAALGELTAGLAHEIRNPLASIKTSVEFLRCAPQNPIDPERPDFASIILEETARLDKILSEFLQFARSEETRVEGEPHHTQLLDSARRVLDLTEAQRRSVNVRVSLDAAMLDRTVDICDSHLQQVLLNLLLNSMDAMPEGGEFRLHYAGHEDGHLLVSVEDTGHGIPSDLASRVFNPFFSTKEQGTGLGLSIVQRILDSHGGSIELTKPIEGTGTRFLLRLPCH